MYIYGREAAVVINEYLSSINLIERLHRQFLEVVKGELDRLGVQDINNVQALILYNIADDELTVGELTNRGYYLGSNVSYNVKKMVEDRKSTSLNSSTQCATRMPSSACKKKTHNKIRLYIKHK